MGDIADGLISGEFDSLTGEYIGPAVGYPRRRHKGRIVAEHEAIDDQPKDVSKAKMNGIHKYLSHRGFEQRKHTKIVHDYLISKGYEIPLTFRKCAKIVQSEFGDFIQHVKTLLIAVSKQQTFSKPKDLRDAKWILRRLVEKHPALGDKEDTLVGRDGRHEIG